MTLASWGIHLIVPHGTGKGDACPLALEAPGAYPSHHPASPAT